MSKEIISEIVEAASTSSSVIVTEEMPGLMQGFEIFIESVTIGSNFVEIEGNDNSIRLLKDGYSIEKMFVGSYELTGISNEITIDLDFVS